MSWEGKHWRRKHNSTGGKLFGNTTGMSDNTTGMSSNTIECYGCHQQVVDLKSHKIVCPNSRKNRNNVSDLSRRKANSMLSCMMPDTGVTITLDDKSGTMFIDKKITLVIKKPENEKKDEKPIGEEI